MRSTIGRCATLMTAALFAAPGCAQAPEAEPSKPLAASDVEPLAVSEAEPREAFDAFWYQGFAEINRYELEQARYGELRKGDAVLLFVTENFDPEKQVKSDSPDLEASGAWRVIKLNAFKRFTTGVYDYSLMSSVFTPVEVEAHPRTLKITTSVQDWCGQVWMQLNERGGRYAVEGRSYFESQGDEEFELDSAWLEDEIWNRIRIDPGRLPTGEIDIVPGTQQSRLRHRPLRVEKATASFTPSVEGVRKYEIDYLTDERSLSIRFESAFPHQILSWEETYLDGFGPSAELLTTRATRTNVLRDPYWKHNGNEDLPLRDALDLPR